MFDIMFDKESKKLPFTVNDIKKSLFDNYTDVYYVDSRHGSGRTAQHASYRVKIGSTYFDDDGIYKTQYAMVQAVQKMFKNIEPQLQKQNIVLIREIASFENGKDYTWNSIRYDDLENVCAITKIEPCKQFLKIQKLLQKGGFNLSITDIYSCNVCQKRSNKSYSNFDYYATDESYCENLLAQLKQVYKSGDKIVVRLTDVENFEEPEYDDRERYYETEQYGYKRTQLNIEITKPSGKKICVIF